MLVASQDDDLERRGERQQSLRNRSTKEPVTAVLNEQRTHAEPSRRRDQRDGNLVPFLHDRGGLARRNEIEIAAHALLIPRRTVRQERHHGDDVTGLADLPGELCGSRNNVFDFQRIDTDCRSDAHTSNISEPLSEIRKEFESSPKDQPRGSAMNR